MSERKTLQQFDFIRAVACIGIDMSSLGAAIGYAYTSAAAFKYAKQANNKKIMATGFVGTIIAIIFAVLLLVPIRGLDCSLGKESYICLVAWVLIGVCFYNNSKNRG